MIDIDYICDHDVARFASRDGIVKLIHHTGCVQQSDAASEVRRWAKAAPSPTHAWL